MTKREALFLLRKRGGRLVVTHGRATAYSVIANGSSGTLQRDDAREILRLPDLVPFDAGFPGHRSPPRVLSFKSEDLVVLDHSCQVQRHTLAERGHDAYQTPPVAVEALLRVERLPHKLWEPCAGKGNVVNVLRAGGHAVIASDLIDYGFPTHFNGRDFLKESKVPAGVEGIITNPPYRLAEAFVEHALKLSPLVVMLLRLAFLESERRCGILENRGLSRVHVFRKRLPRMRRTGEEERGGNAGMGFAWFCWSRDHTGPAVIDRISWER